MIIRLIKSFVALSKYSSLWFVRIPIGGEIVKLLIGMTFVPLSGSECAVLVKIEIPTFSRTIYPLIKSFYLNKSLSCAHAQKQKTGLKSLALPVL
ncbi:hypothetical protein AXI57_04170 [Bacillus atrophaeus]|nr:hypothetical protein AXI57_04170 [Bacillus atrophaeus]